MASRSWNRVELIGNLTRDPELRFTPQGSAVCTFSIATNRTYVSEGEKKEEVDFHRCVSWNKLAELCNQLLKKGNRTFISGRLQNRSWESADGQTRNVTEIVIEDMIVLTPRVNGEPAVANVEPPPIGISTPSQSVVSSTDDSSTKKSASKKDDDDESKAKKEENKKEEVDESDLPF